MGCLWGGGDRVSMRVCAPCGAGGVCVRVPGVCLGMVQAERDAARRKGRRSVKDWEQRKDVQLFGTPYPSEELCHPR